MLFYIRRYLAAFQERKHWIFMAVVPVVLYLIVAALRIDSFSITQDFVYSGDVRLSAVNDSRDTLTLEQLLADPDRLFLDTLAFGQLQQRLEHQENIYIPSTNLGLKRLVHGTMELSSMPELRLRLAYEGSNARLGEIMVDFYSDRLAQRVRDGAARRPTPENGAPYSFQADGGMSLLGVASPWSTERAPRAVLILFLSLLAVLLLIGLLELSDPSFKSERQIARYLDLPVLGSMPDATRLARHFKEN